MLVKKIFFVIIILLISSFSGCTLFQSTELKLISSDILDNDGFVTAEIKFNASNQLNLKLIDSKGVELFSQEYLKGTHTALVYLDEYRETPPLGSYKLKAYDDNGNVIYEDEYIFTSKNVVIMEILDYWWLEDKYSLVGLNIALKNKGDLPIYPYEVEVKIDGRQSSGFILPTVILPLQTKNVYSLIYLEDILFNNNVLKISIKNSEEEIIAQKEYDVIPSQNLNELKFSWRYLGNNNLVIPDIDFLYDYYKDQDRFESSDYAAYVFDPYDDRFIDVIANKLKSSMGTSTDVSIINSIASFVQNLDYEEDITDCDYPRFPIETLKDNKGDCEDKAILAASILESMGYNVSLIQLPKHVAVGVNLDEDVLSSDYYIDEYYYLETSSRNWYLGKVPPEHSDQTDITVYSLLSRPIIVHSWKNATRYSETDGSDYVKMIIIVKNLGTKTAYNLDIWGAFYQDNGLYYNLETTSLDAISKLKKEIVRLTMDVPKDVLTKLKTQILQNDITLHERESSSYFP